MRHAFDKHGGSLGEPGSVAWQFEKKGAIIVDGSRYSEDDLMVAIDAGAEDVQADGDSLRVLSPVEDLRGPCEPRSTRQGSRSSRPSW